MCKQFPHMVICDFDGTVTTRDTFWGLCNAVCGKDAVNKMMKRHLDGEIPVLIDACLALIESIPASDLPRVDAYMQTMRFAPDLKTSWSISTESEYRSSFSPEGWTIP